MNAADADQLETIGLLVVEWGRLEERFPVERQGPRSPSVDTVAAASQSGISEGQIHRARSIRNRAVHRPSNRPSLDELDEALGILELVWRRLDGEIPVVTSATSARHALPLAATTGANPPAAYPNPRSDNPWDNDAVHWLLEKPDVAVSYKRGPLFECLRCQPRRVEAQPHRVDEAARLARKHGVIQRQEYDAKLGKRVVRLYRTDPGRPKYPGAPPDRSADQ